MCSFVPLKVALGQKGGLALLAKVFPLAFVPLFVYPQMELLPEHFSTQVTSLLLVLLVDQHVGSQHARLGEGLVADLAFVRAVASVDACVDFQRPLFGKSVNEQS